MAKLEALEDEIKRNYKYYRKKRYHGSTKFFVFVDYLFLVMFIVFLGFILLKIIGL